MNVALSELPDFTCLLGKVVAEHHQSGIVIAPSLDYMDEAYRDAKTVGWSRKSTLDVPSLYFCASLLCRGRCDER